MSELEDIHIALIKEVKLRLFEESVPRLKKCMDELSEEEVWQRPNEHSNSMGNLVLHLCGNVRQWIGHGIGGNEDNRLRQAEFDERGPIPKEKLLHDLDVLMLEVDQMLSDMEPEQLLASASVQGFETTGLSILVHVTEHFSYHVGQMTYYVKALKDLDMGYYQNVDL